MKGLEAKDIELLFQDEMRYGLISNYRRSWSKKGERTQIKNQQQFENRYLYSSLSPLTGDGFHLYSLGEMDGITMKVYLEAMKKSYGKKHLLIIWDNAPCHRLKVFREMEGITIVHLPSYSPQLNPAERFFEEMRKSTADRIFESIEEQEERIDTAIMEYMNDTERTKKLIGYEWILRQWAMVF
jgi:transposase